MIAGITKRILSSKKVRFAGVGVINTITDFFLFFLLAKLLGFPVLLANIFSTSAALSVSYLLNKKAVFKNTDTTSLRQVSLFVGVTLTGLWIVQSIIIWLLIPFIERMLPGADGWEILIAKLVATGASLLWNYLLYSRLVFKER